MRKILFLLILPTITLATSGAGDYLTSEEDILAALSNEEISFTQYYDLLDLFRDKVNIFGPEIDRLMIIPGVDQRWIIAIENAATRAGIYADRETFIKWFPYDFERIASFVAFLEDEQGVFGGGAKIYTHGKFIDCDYPTTNISISGRYRNFDIELSLIEEEDEIRCKRRSISAKLLGGKLELGGFREGLGEGLIIGKAFHVPSAERINSTAGSFVNPKDNLFNGVRFDGKYGKIGIGLLASYIVYDSIAVDALGSEFHWAPSKDIEVGGVFAHGSVVGRPSNLAYRQSSTSLFCSSRLYGADISSEIGITEGGGTGFMLNATKTLSRTKTLAEFWLYDEEFHPLHSEGPSDYRETEIELAETGIIHESRQAGETGAQLKVTTPIVNNASLNFEQAGWRTTEINDWGLSSEIGIYYRDDNGKRIYGDFTWEKRTLTSTIRLKETIRLRANWPLSHNFTTNGYLRFRWTTDEDYRKRSLITYLELKASHFEPLVLKMRLKRSKSDLTDDDNGYWEIKLRDELRSGPVIWIGEVRHARYDRPSKEPLTEFRITAGYYWR